MADRYDVVVFRKDEKTGKEYSTRVGVAWPFKDGKDGFNINLDFPVGVAKFTLFPPKPKKENGDDVGPF